MDASVPQSTATQIAQGIRDNQLSAEDAFNNACDAIAKSEQSIKAFCHQTDRFAGSTNKDGPLAGVPVAVKDCICTSDMPTTACSKMLETFSPPYDATVVQRLRDAGATIVGKTNMDEFAMGSSTENSCFAPTRNPWNVERVPGGSSGGSAAAVAAGMVPLSLGTDTGGSIRQPASFCGITGLKPTYGRVSRLGLIAFASSLDQIGPMGRTAEDVALLLNVIAGHDPNDSTSSYQPTENFLTACSQPLPKLKIGICQSQLTDGVDPAVVSAVEEAKSVFEKLGAEFIEIELPHEKYAVATYYIVAPCEASSNLSRYDGVRYTKRATSSDLNAMYTQTRQQFFGDEVKRRVMLGTYALSSGYYDQFYVKASKVRRLIKQDFDTAFQSVDFILGPTSPSTAFRIGELVDDPIQMYLADVFTVSANLAGIPAISIPCGFSESLPIGLHLQGPAFGESKLLQAAHHYQRQTDWHLRSPSQ